LKVAVGLDDRRDSVHLRAMPERRETIAFSSLPKRSPKLPKLIARGETEPEYFPKNFPLLHAGNRDQDEIEKLISRSEKTSVPGPLSGTQEPPRRQRGKTPKSLSHKPFGELLGLH